MFPKPDVIAEITIKILMWDRHARRKKRLINKTGIKENPFDKRPLGRSHLRWENCVKRDVQVVEPNTHWREVSRGLEGRNQEEEEGSENILDDTSKT